MKKKKKDMESEDTTVAGGGAAIHTNQISTRADLLAFVSDVRDKLLKDEAAPIFAMVAMQQVMTLDAIYDLLDKEIKEILQEIWVKLSQQGFHLRRPPLLFGEGEAVVS